MKTLYLLFAFFTFSLSAQYMPLLEPGTQWNQHHSFSTVGGLTDSIQLTERDTVINSQTYQIAEGKLVPAGWNLSDSLGFLLLREDTMEKKVWLYFENEEHLLYDFSALPGDTVTIFSNTDQPNFCATEVPFVIVGIDTFTDLHMMDRRRLEVLSLLSSYDGCYEEGLYTTYWIEGIGSTRGFNENTIGLMETSLLCVWKPQGQVYKNATYDTCFINSLYINENSWDAFSINTFPNPATDQLTLRYTHHQADVLSIRLFDIQGQKVYDKKTQAQAGTHEKHLSVGHLRSGMYILEVSGEYGIKSKSKIVISR